ncbi:MAG: peptidoglycan glycosyltransferase, partial [Candidatus Marinimicrobia bacterium]|nr:peptidoglycan glycosyltransferase [Candidatus Neomarinimicrobiota bacterium]
LKDVTLYGKTGTAQNPLGEPHSWFIGFTDTGDEKVAIAVIIEYGGSGGSNAAVVARKVLEHYYRLKAEVVRK